MQFLKSLTPGGVPNGDPSPRNRRFQTAFQFCVVGSKCRWATEQALSKIIADHAAGLYAECMVGTPSTVEFG